MRVVVVLKGYPRLSETFIAQELLALEERGLELVIVSLRQPTDPYRHPIHGQIRAAVHYLPERLRDEPGRVWRAARRAWRWPGLGACLVRWWRDLRRDWTVNRARRLGQALVLADEVLHPGDHVYAHFLHTPGSVARYAAILCDRPLGLSAHAKDIWTLEPWEKREKLDDARFAVTCTELGATHLNGLLDGPPKVELLYHGLDLGRWPRPVRAAAGDDGPVTFLCVARAVPKKGLDVLLRALALLPRDREWRFVHIGGGELDPLRELATQLGLEHRVRFEGPLAAPAVLDAYRRAHVFVMASRIAADGDRDGLPNVLMEASSQELAIVATATAAIPELVEHEANGLLVAPEDAVELAAALNRVLTEPELRRRLGQEARRRLERDFSMRRGIDRLATLLGAGDLADAA